MAWHDRLLAMNLLCLQHAMLTRQHIYKDKRLHDPHSTSEHIHASALSVHRKLHIFSSFQEWANTMARHPSSVRPSVNFCANRFFSQKNGRIATKLSQDKLQVSVHPGCAQGQGQGKGQRLRDTGTFVLARKSLLLPGKWLDRNQTCTRWSPSKPESRVCSSSRSRSKVTWYAHFLGFLEWATPSLTVWL